MKNVKILFYSLVLVCLSFSFAFAEIIIDGAIPSNFKNGAYDLHNFITEYNNNKLTIIDVRTEQEFAIAHLENSINMPIDTVFKENISQLNQYENIVLMCAAGKRAARAYSMLADQAPELLKKVKFLDASVMFKANGDAVLKAN